MKSRKIKYNHPGNKNLRTERQIESARLSMTNKLLFNHPMRNPEIAKKNGDARRGKKNPDLTLRNILNNPSKVKSGFKGKHHTEENKLKLSIDRIGKPLTHLNKYKFTTEFLTKNNPMRNPEIAKKNGDMRKKKIPEPQFKNIVSEFNSGKSITQLAKENNIWRSVLSRILKDNGVKIERKERLIIYAKNNPEIQKGWFKKNNKVYPIILMVFLSILWYTSLVLAVGANEAGILVSTSNNVITVEGYTSVGIPQTDPQGHYTGTQYSRYVSPDDYLIIKKKKIDFTTSQVCNTHRNITNESTNITETFFKDCTFSFSIPQGSVEIPFLRYETNFTPNNTVPVFVDQTTQTKYEQCMQDNLNLQTNIRNIAADLARVNNTYPDYVRCNTELQKCISDKSTCEANLKQKETDATNNKNQVFLWLAAGLVVGAFGTLYFKGFIGNPKLKHADELYNRGQSS